MRRVTGGAEGGQVRRLQGCWRGAGHEMQKAKMECNSKGVARRRCGHLEDLARDRIAAALERVVVRDAARALVWWERERGGGAGLLACGACV